MPAQIGWSKDYKQELRAQTLLSENIVFYRRADGSPVALEDACPHRKLPLSYGQLNEDKVICGYHGLTFDCSGSCVEAPTQRANIPRRAVVKSYPVVDRYRLLWIWMGDPFKANPDDIFEIKNFDNPDWGYTEGGVLPKSSTSSSQTTLVKKCVCNENVFPPNSKISKIEPETEL